jgi:hypothetical protein
MSAVSVGWVRAFSTHYSLQEICRMWDGFGGFLLDWLGDCLPDSKTSVFAIDTRCTVLLIV